MAPACRNSGHALQLRHRLRRRLVIDIAQPKLALAVISPTAHLDLLRQQRRAFSLGCGQPQSLADRIPQPARIGRANSRDTQRKDRHHRRCRRPRRRRREPIHERRFVFMLGTPASPLCVGQPPARPAPKPGTPASAPAPRPGPQSRGHRSARRTPRRCALIAHRLEAKLELLVSSHHGSISPASSSRSRSSPLACNIFTAPGLLPTTCAQCSTEKSCTKRNAITCCCSSVSCASAARKSVRIPAFSSASCRSRTRPALTSSAPSVTSSGSRRRRGARCRTATPAPARPCTGSA